MANRLLTLALCLAVLPPPQFCACHLLAHSHPAGAAEPDAGHSHKSTGSCHAHARRSGTPAGRTAEVRGGSSHHACPCCCHSDTPGDPSDCPHSAREAVAESPEPGAFGDPPALPVPFPRASAAPVPPAHVDHSLFVPGYGRVPLYLAFCSLRN